MSSPPLILAASCTFPSGPTIELADAAVRAQLLLQNRHPSYLDGAGAPTRASFFPIAYPFDSNRWAMLMLNALEQLCGDLQRDGVNVETHAHHLWLVLPDAATRFGVPTDLEPKLKHAATQMTDKWQQIHIVRGGHAAGVTALVEASDLVSAKSNALAIVVGVESGLSQEGMMWLDMQSLLHGAQRASRTGFRAEAYGRIPGEGAAALALVSKATKPGDEWAALLGCATAQEAVTYQSSEPCVGAGLTKAAQSVLQQGARYRAAPTGCITVDLNGEPYRGDQFGFTALRIGKALQDNWQRSLPALASGDINAASAVAHVALAAYTLAKRPTKSSHLILASSDDTLRGAVLLGATKPVTQHREVRPWRSPSISTV
jgi:3-oxoacyl-[acyl-carrier-protein] synthase-1